jgi:hypothetical protein
VPWDGCKLVHAQAIYSETVAGANSTGVHEIDLELDSAGGTELMTISLVSNMTVGTVTDATFSNEASCRNLLDSNSIMIEMDGAAGATVFGGVMVYLYFEPDNL